MARRIVLITGGARGIGRAIGLDLAGRGFDVALCYRTSEAEAERTASELRAAGARALAVRADVSDAAACERLVEATQRELGGTDALVHCAGPYHRVDVLAETVEGWNEMFAHNLHPLFYLARLVAPGMKARGWGRILCFSMATADRLSAQPQITAKVPPEVIASAVDRTPERMDRAGSSRLRGAPLRAKIRQCARAGACSCSSVLTCPVDSRTKDPTTKPERAAARRDGARRAARASSASAGPRTTRGSLPAPCSASTTYRRTSTASGA